MKKIFISFLLTGIFVGIGILFWYADYQYALPTPVPEGYRPVPAGRHVSLSGLPVSTNNKPVLLHFFNPECPCSRFNMRYFKTLSSSYKDKVQMVVVLLNTEQHSPDEVRKKFGLDIPVVYGPELAKACGVYATPQAVILKPGGELFYRGNYNLTRYCTDKKTEFARLALDDLLRGTVHTASHPLATRAYGCSLPKCNL